MIRSGVIDPRRTVADGTDNISGSLTNLIEEKPLSPGSWAFSADRDYNLQVNLASGGGMGIHPQIWFGFRQTLGSSLHVVYDGDTVLIHVPVGEIRYLLFRKSIFFAGDGIYSLNRITGP